MTHMARIRAKGLDATGVTEEVAKAMYATLGGATMAIVELEHVRHSDDSKGDHQVELVIGLCEPALTDRMSDHLRELSRAMYKDRRTSEGEPLPLDAPGPSTDDVIDQGEALLDREPDGEVAGTWDGDTDTPGKPLVVVTDT